MSGRARGRDTYNAVGVRYSPTWLGRRSSGGAWSFDQLASVDALRTCFALCFCRLRLLRVFESVDQHAAAPSRRARRDELGGAAAVLAQRAQKVALARGVDVFGGAAAAAARGGGLVDRLRALLADLETTRACILRHPTPTRSGARRRRSWSLSWRSRSSSSSAVLNDARSVAEAPRSPRSWRKQSAFSSFVTSPAAYRCDAVVFARSAAIIASTSSSFASASAAASASDSRSTRSANRRPAAPPIRRATRVELPPRRRPHHDGERHLHSLLRDLAVRVVDDRQKHVDHDEDDEQHEGEVQEGREQRVLDAHVVELHLAHAEVDERNA